VKILGLNSPIPNYAATSSLNSLKEILVLKSDTGISRLSFQTTSTDSCLLEVAFYLVDADLVLYVNTAWSEESTLISVFERNWSPCWLDCRFLNESL
jgi:hypothetical protein